MADLILRPAEEPPLHHDFNRGRGIPRYGLKPYRERGRRYSTVIVRAPKAFQNGTPWPEFLALSEELHAHLNELTERVIREAINEDVSEAAESPIPKALPGSSST